MVEKPDEVARVREFLEKKIESLRKELENYEFLLNLLNESERMDRRRTKDSSEDVIVIGGRAVAVLTRKSSEFFVKLINPVKPEDLRIDSFRNKLSLLVPMSFSIDTERDERGYVAAIKVGNLKNPSNMDAAVKVLRKHLETVFKEND